MYVLIYVRRKLLNTQKISTGHYLLDIPSCRVWQHICCVWQFISLKFYKSQDSFETRWEGRGYEPKNLLNALMDVSAFSWS